MAALTTSAVPTTAATATPPAQQCDQCELGRPTKDEPRAGPPDERVHPGQGDGETDDQPERDRRYEQGQGVDHPWRAAARSTDMSGRICADVRPDRFAGR